MHLFRSSLGADSFTGSFFQCACSLDREKGKQTKNLSYNVINTVGTETRVRGSPENSRNN